MKSVEIGRFAGMNRFLSNFYPSPINVRGHFAPTVEHAFQACKTFDVTEFEQVLDADTPTQAKRLGRSVRLRADWEEAKISVMRELLALKFARRTLLARNLLDTGDAVLVEGNTWYDTFWGVCNGKGENWLGHLLMARRAELRGLILESDGDQSP